MRFTNLSLGLISLIVAGCCTCPQREAAPAEKIGNQPKAVPKPRKADGKLVPVPVENVKQVEKLKPVEVVKPVEAPKKVEEDYDKTFTKVEIESEYPGGAAAWHRYLSKNLVYPDEAVSAEIQGQVVVRFIVDKEGNVSDVEAVSGPEELRDAAVRVIKKSGNWNPAIQNGRKVKSYKSQPINFRLESQ